MTDPRPVHWNRRDVLRAGGAAAALVATGALAIACGKGGTEATGKPAKPVRDVPGRPPTAKTTKKAHKPQPAVGRKPDPLPAPLQAYIERKYRDGALLRNSKTNVVHHPVLCQHHLNGEKPKPRRHRKPTARHASPAKPVTRRKPHAGVVVHAPYADGILYALLRAEQDKAMQLGLALTCALTWPSSVRYADLALASMKKDGKPVVDEAAVTAALLAAQSQGGALATPIGPTGARTASALALLKNRLAQRAAQHGRPKKGKRTHR